MEKKDQTDSLQGHKVERLYSVRQVAKMLGMARATIKRKVEAGYIRTTKDGLISESSLADYIQGK